MRRALIIEDDDLLRDALAARLESLGWEVSAASGGPEGVALAPGFRPDVVLCDLLLPGTDGYGVLQDLRARGVGAPFLLLTEPDLRHRRLSAEGPQADAFLVKPFEPWQLEAKLDQVTLPRA